MAGPMALIAWPFCSWLTFTSVLLITAVSMAAAYVVGRGAKATAKVDLTGKNVIVTGTLCLSLAPALSSALSSSAQLTRRLCVL
jgi:hypothetical protein